MVRQRDTGQIFAMKMLHKWEMLKRAEVSVESGGPLGTLQMGMGEAYAARACGAWRGVGKAADRAKGATLSSH